MHKDSLILLLMLAVFALVGADCQAPWEDDDEKPDPLPDRALASSPLLRAYYETRTIPKGMRELKIPEGDDFDDDELTIEFEMGGAEVVTTVSTHLNIYPPKDTEFNEVELVCRCVAPDGTKSSWKAVDVQSAESLRTEVEVPFHFEFDGLISDGTWKIQLRDPQDDNDGRCVFRNGSLHINRGEASGLGGAANETQTLDFTAGNYGILPEAQGGRGSLDMGDFGTKVMLRNDLVFTSSFFVQVVSITVSFYANVDNDPAQLALVLVSPSGNWLATQVGDTPSGSIDLGSSLLNTHDFTFGSLPNGVMLNLNGEPSAGTWTLYLVDSTKDGNTGRVTTDRADNTVGIVPNGAEISINLAGIN